MTDGSTFDPAVGISQPTLRRALIAGLAFGAVVLLVAAVRFALADAFDRSLATGQLLWVAVGIGLFAPTLGAAVRGLLPDAPSDAARSGPSED